MYYLAKFCRICIKTGVKLLDINTLDFDCVTFSEKLELCTKMVINRESLSTLICLQCIKKLRMSYDFQKMCKQSTKILQGYLTELISTSSKICPESFVNSELRVTLTPLGTKSPRKRKRITKEQRCSLLKRLLLSRRNHGKKYQLKKRQHQRESAKYPQKGGLRSIIDFTRNFDFGYKIDSNHNCQINEPTPLSRLTNFTNTFFINNFTEFRDTILYIIENKDTLSESDDDEAMFQENIHEPELVKCEELVVEPDIKIKTELDYDDGELYSCNYYVETSYSDSECKKESCDEDAPIKQENFPLYENAEQPHNSVQMLDKLVGNLGQHRKTFSPHSVRCRTRGNPYINPKLKQQFQFKSFQCDKCSRYFKSPGYLKAHVSKVHS